MLRLLADGIKGRDLPELLSVSSHDLWSVVRVWVPAHTNSWVRCPQVIFARLQLVHWYILALVIMLFHKQQASRADARFGQIVLQFLFSLQNPCPYHTACELPEVEWTCAITRSLANFLSVESPPPCGVSLWMVLCLSIQL